VRELGEAETGTFRVLTDSSGLKSLAALAAPRKVFRPEGE